MRCGVWCCGSVLVGTWMGFWGERVRGCCDGSILFVIVRVIIVNIGVVFWKEFFFILYCELYVTKVCMCDLMDSKDANCLCQGVLYSRGIKKNRGM